MKILHLISGGDDGGAKTHVITLLKELSQYEDITLVCLLDESFAKEAKEAGIHVVILKQEKRYNLQIVNQLVDHLKDGYDLLHCHGARANFLGMFIKRKYKIPMVSTIHSDYRSDFDNNIYKKMVYTPLNYMSLKRMDYFIAITEQFKCMLVKRGFKEDKIYVAYNGIAVEEKPCPLTKEAFLEQYGLTYDKNIIYIGIVSRLHPVKGIPVFLNAAAKVRQRNTRIQFLIAGYGDDKHTEKYKDYVKQQGLEEVIHFLGFVKDIPSFHGAIDINVLTSHSESFPYALLEGGLHRKATITSAVGGIPEMIEHDKSGLLFEDGDHEALSHAMEKLADDEALRIALGDALFKRIQNHFSDKKMARMHVDIYEDILKHHHRK